jgi:hypothetical protein
MVFRTLETVEQVASIAETVPIGGFGGFENDRPKRINITQWVKERNDAQRSLMMFVGPKSSSANTSTTGRQVKSRRMLIIRAGHARANT